MANESYSIHEDGDLDFLASGGGHWDPWLAHGVVRLGEIGLKTTRGDRYIPSVVRSQRFDG